jgi:hypothetical protein
MKYLLSRGEPLPSRSAIRKESKKEISFLDIEDGIRDEMDASQRIAPPDLGVALTRVRELSTLELTREPALCAPYPQPASLDQCKQSSAWWVESLVIPLQPRLSRILSRMARKAWGISDDMRNQLGLYRVVFKSLYSTMTMRIAQYLQYDEMVCLRRCLEIAVPREESAEAFERHFPARHTLKHSDPPGDKNAKELKRKEAAAVAWDRRRDESGGIMLFRMEEQVEVVSTSVVQVVSTVTKRSYTQVVLGEKVGRKRPATRMTKPLALTGTSASNSSGSGISISIPASSPEALQPIVPFSPLGKRTKLSYSSLSYAAAGTDSPQGPFVCYICHGVEGSPEALLQCHDAECTEPHAYYHVNCVHDMDIGTTFYCAACTQARDLL